MRMPSSSTIWNAGVAPTEPFEVFGSLTDGTTQVVFGLNEGDSINFIS